MGENDKGKKTIKERLSGAIQAAKKGIDKLLTPSETVSYHESISRELIEKLSGYYDGVEPVISDLEILEALVAGQFNVSAKVTNLRSAVSGIQEADLLAEVEVSEMHNFIMPTPGFVGIDTIPPSFIPVFDPTPKINRIALEITNATLSSEAAYGRIQEILNKSYPSAKPLDMNTPLSITSDTLFCERLVRDTAADSKGRNRDFFRLLKFSVKKAAVDRKVDDCLFVKDYEYQLEPPEEIFSLEFPKSEDLLPILKKEKGILLKQVDEFLGAGSLNFFNRLFFRIRVPVRKIEPNDNISETDVSFSIEFDCAAGFNKLYSVTTEIFFSIARLDEKKGGKTANLKYLRHGDFVIRQATS